jgi:hypothetical protein
MIWAPQSASYSSSVQVSTHYAQQWTQHPSPLRTCVATEGNSAVPTSYIQLVAYYETSQIMSNLSEARFKPECYPRSA